jgi:hypothetical protein
VSNIAVAGLTRGETAGAIQFQGSRVARGCGQGVLVLVCDGCNDVAVHPPLSCAASNRVVGRCAGPSQGLPGARPSAPLMVPAQEAPRRQRHTVTGGVPRYAGRTATGP